MTEGLDPRRWTLSVSDEPGARRAAFRTRFEALASEAMRDRGRFSVALTGGSTVGKYYPVLVEADVDWSMVHVLFGDERAVGADHPDSNYRASREAFLDQVGVPDAQVHRMEGERADPRDAAARYETALAEAVGAGGRIDLVHLGIGPDGHVASLFPGHDALQEADRTAVAIHDSPKPPPRRITLTMPVLTGAREVWLFAAGQNKAPVLERAATVPSSELPLARVLQRSGRVTVFVDAANAGLFPPDTPRG